MWGRLLLTHARQLDSATRDLERDIALTQGLELGELRIGVGPYGGSALVGPALGRLNLAHPGLRLKTVLAPWQELPDRARARDVDLIVVELSQVQLMDDFAVQGAERAWPGGGVPAAASRWRGWIRRARPRCSAIRSPAPA
jgi:DNA-binding transcriptional LysR family regulator